MYYATNWKPELTPDEKLKAEKALLSQPYKTLSSDAKKNLYLDTRILFRHNVDDPQFSIDKLMEKFGWLDNVSFKT